jgi:glycosyltransferase involved in cell wall biosynthesis
MKIIIISPSLDVSHVAGISSVTRFIINSNTENKYVHFELGKSGDNRNLLWFFGILKAYLKWGYLLLTQKGILIHFNTALQIPSVFRDSPLILIARLLNIRMIIHLHGGDYLMYKKMPIWMKWILKWSFSGHNPKIVLSPLELEELKQRLSISNLFILPNCPDLNDATNFNRTFKKQEILRLLYLGRITDEKGMEFIFNALKLLNRNRVKFKFVMAGNGPQEKLYVQKFSDLLGSDFDFKGVVSGDKKTEILKNCDVFLLPSFFEGLPMALLESMSFGLVPIVTDVGSIKHVITDGENGIFVNKYSSEDIVFAIEKLSMDKEYKHQLSRNARRYIFENFSPKDYIDQLNKLYNYE